MSAKENWDRQWDQWDRDAGGVDVIASDLVVTTREGAEVVEYAPLTALLRRAHQAFGIEMVFVSEMCGGEAVARPGTEAGALHALHAHGVLACMGPVKSAAFHVHTWPVITGDGLARGTLCLRLPLRAPLDAQMESALRGVARLIGQWFESAAADAAQSA